MLDRLGHWLGAFLSRQTHVHGVSAPTPPELLLRYLRPGDVVLVEGNSRVSALIKYFTQSTWSHAALYVGDALHSIDRSVATDCFVEADLADGVRSVGVDAFNGYPTRICRPVGLSDDDRDKLVAYVVQRIGYRYDLRNLFDLARYLLPWPPVPQHLRRRVMMLGSGDPTRVACSTLIAQAFQSIRYPILPDISRRALGSVDCPGCVEEILHARHHSFFVPRDFDVSPYFEVVKPTIEAGFDFRALKFGQSEHTNLITPVNDPQRVEQPSSSTG